MPPTKRQPQQPVSFSPTDSEIDGNTGVFLATKTENHATSYEISLTLVHDPKPRDGALVRHSGQVYELRERYGGKRRKSCVG